MEPWLFILLPFLLILARVSAFMAAAPVLSSPAVPSIVKAGIAFWLSVFLSQITPIPAAAITLQWLTAVLLIAQEILVGLAFGLATRLLFSAIRQGGAIIALQMGLSEAGIIDPMSGEEDDSIGTFLETVVSIAFLGAGGHLLLIALLAKTYHGFPMGAAPDTAALANGLVTTGSIMLLMGLKLAAPVLAAFLILAVVLAILARVLPEINVLFESFPLRVGLGLLMTAALLPGMNSFVSDLASWMNKLVT